MQEANACLSARSIPSSGKGLSPRFGGKQVPFPPRGKGPLPPSGGREGITSILGVLAAAFTWYLIFSIAGATDKVAFDNALPGNGFDVWRRIVTPLGRSEARLHNMHKDVTRPTASRRLTDVMRDLEKWESKLAEYYRFGGDQLSDKTLPLTALDMLPSRTNPSVHMAIHTARTYEELKVTLRKTITYLEDHGALGGPSAHRLTDALASGESAAISVLPAAQLCERWPGDANIQDQDEPRGQSAEGALAEELCAMLMSKSAQRRSGGMPSTGWAKGGQAAIDDAGYT